MNQTRYQQELKKTAKIPYSKAAEFMLSFKGYEFSYNGKVIPKHYIYRWSLMTGREPGEFFTIKDKPGWHDGKKISSEKYNDYLKNVNFVY